MVHEIPNRTKKLITRNCWFSLGLAHDHHGPQFNWLMVYQPLWKIWVRQWWWNSQWKNKTRVNHQPDINGGVSSFFPRKVSVGGLWIKWESLTKWRIIGLWCYSIQEGYDISFNRFSSRKNHPSKWWFIFPWIFQDFSMAMRQRMV